MFFMDPAPLPLWLQLVEAAFTCMKDAKKSGETVLPMKRPSPACLLSGKKGPEQTVSLTVLSDRCDDVSHARPADMRRPCMVWDKYSARYGTGERKRGEIE